MDDIDEVTNTGRIVLNGIDGTTGQYLVPPKTTAEVAALARGETAPEVGLDPDATEHVRAASTRFALPFDVDPLDLARAGWGLIFAEGGAPAGLSVDDLKTALQPLADHRAKTSPASRLKVLDYRPGEQVRAWLGRHGVSPGNIAPTKVPYYLTVVGDPSAIPFSFQYLLDIEYAVGRLSFDSIDGYRQYVESVVAYETGGAVPNAREIVYWGPRHAADAATQMSADHLITPLVTGFPPNVPVDEMELSPVADLVSFGMRCLKRNDATRANLAEVFHRGAGSKPPAVLFTASHGMGWPSEDPRQVPNQGALLCQDWTGFGTIQPQHYLTAADVADDAHVHGLVAFLFACFGAGTPELDDFMRTPAVAPPRLAPKPFVAALPQRLLSHPGGGALAVIGHVERAWGYSIKPPGVGPQLVPFRNCLGRIMSGEPVGHSTKDINERFSTLSTFLLEQVDPTSTLPKVSDADLVAAWVERNDSRNYVLLGDPATRLRSDVLV
jgi:hypothetical protein